MERSLSILVDRLERTYKDALVSVILYGSAASGSYDGSFSDLNVLCVLKKLTPEELFQSEPVFRWWRELGNPAPLLMTDEEVRASADCFAIEFSDMLERRKVLRGTDVIAGLVVERRFYRAQVEYQLRSKLLRLRQQAAGLWTDRDQLLRLCLDSVSTFYVLGKHAVALGGQGGKGDRRGALRHIAACVGDDLSAFDALFDVRERRTAPQEADPATLFTKYLTSIEAIIRYVDGL